MTDNTYDVLFLGTSNSARSIPAVLPMRIAA